MPSLLHPPIPFFSLSTLIWWYHHRQGLRNLAQRTFLLGEKNNKNKSLIRLLFAGSWGRLPFAQTNGTNVTWHEREACMKNTRRSITVLVSGQKRTPSPRNKDRQQPYSTVFTQHVVSVAYRKVPYIQYGCHLVEALILIFLYRTKCTLTACIFGMGSPSPSQTVKHHHALSVHNNRCERAAP